MNDGVYVAKGNVVSGTEGKEITVTIVWDSLECPTRSELIEVLNNKLRKFQSTYKEFMNEPLEMNILPDTFSFYYEPYYELEN